MSQIFENEIEQVRELFNLEEIVEFQSTHRVEIIKEDHNQYHCYIDCINFGAGLTHMGALVFCMKSYKEKAHTEEVVVYGDHMLVDVLKVEEHGNQREVLFTMDGMGYKYTYYKGVGQSASFVRDVLNNKVYDPWDSKTYKNEYYAEIGRVIFNTSRI